MPHPAIAGRRCHTPTPAVRGAPTVPRREAADNNTVQGIGKDRGIPAPLLVPLSSPGPGIAALSHPGLL
eukprot:15432493-Alexandrium_andersonii.AAC.1